MAPIFRELGKECIKRFLPQSIQAKFREHFLGRRILTKNFKPDPELLLLKQILRPADVVYDIGANAGGYTIHLSECVGEKGKIHAFEPVPATFAVLRKVVEKGKLNNVNPLMFCVAEAHSQMEMIIPDDVGFSGFYCAHLAREGEKGSQNRIKVELRSLDELICDKKLETPTFIKCDVEGACLRVLNGSLTLMEAHHPAWLIEVANKRTHDQVFDLMHERGYEIYICDSGKFRRVKKFERKYGEDYFFLHPATEVYCRAIPTLLGEPMD